MFPLVNVNTISMTCKAKLNTTEYNQAQSTKVLGHTNQGVKGQKSY